MSQLNRRRMVYMVGGAGVGILATACSAPGNSQTQATAPAASPAAASPAASTTVDPAIERRSNTMTPDEALKMLADGNKRFVEGQLANPRHSYARVQDTAVDEFPFAAILCSADSRVSPEIVFDQGIGDLFVSRIFGFVATKEVIETMEYAVATLRVPLIMIMGSDREPAVQAVLREQSSVVKNMTALAPVIEPAVKENRGLNEGSDLSASIKANAKLQAKKMGESAILKKAVQEGKLKIVTAYYDLDDATVEVEEA